MEYKELDRLQEGLKIINELPVLEHNISGEEVEYIYVEKTPGNIEAIEEFNGLYIPEVNDIRAIIDEATFDYGGASEEVIDLAQIMYGDLFSDGWDIWWQRDKGFYIPDWEDEQVYVDHENKVIYMDVVGLKWWDEIQLKGKSHYEAVALISQAGGTSGKRLYSSLDDIGKNLPWKLTSLEKLLVGTTRANALRDNLIVGITNKYAVKPNRHISGYMYNNLMDSFNKAYADSDPVDKEPTLSAVAKVLQSEDYLRGYSKLDESLKAVAVIDFLSLALNLGITAFEKED